MFRRARELGPPFLVPLAWTFVTATALGVVDEYVLFVAHVVMSVLLAAFAVTGRSDMQTGVLNAWWWVIAVGVLPAVSGVVGFRLGAPQLLGVAVVGWMLLPAAGFVYTAQGVSEGAWIYWTGTAGCLLGVVLYGGGVLVGATAPTVAGLALVGLGQTAGILDAALRY
jgi:hypothetical protein